MKGGVTVLRRLTPELLQLSRFCNCKHKGTLMLLASDYDKSKYLRAADLKRDTKFRIKAVTEEIFENNGKQEKRPVLWFTTIDQGLVLNKTNLRTLSGGFGDPMGAWVGKVIAVFPMMADFRGKMTPALRVRIPPPKQVGPQQPTAPQQPVTSGDGAALPVAAAVPLAKPAAVDPELENDLVKPIDDDLDDEVAF
jgi:hypothetical protein